MPEETVPAYTDADRVKQPLALLTNGVVVFIIYRLVPVLVATMGMGLLKSKLRTMHSWAIGHKLWCTTAIVAGVAIGVGIFGLFYVFDLCGTVVSCIFEPVAVGAALAGMGGGGANGAPRGGLRSLVSDALLWTSLAFIGRFLFVLTPGASMAAAVVLVLCWRLWPLARRRCRSTVSDAEVDALEVELDQCVADHADLAHAASTIDGTFAALVARLEAEVQRARQGADEAPEAALEKPGQDLAAMKQLAAQQRVRRKKDIEALEQRAAEAARKASAEAAALRQAMALEQRTEVLRQRIKTAMEVHSKLAVDHASDDRRYRHHKGELERLGRCEQGLSVHKRSFDDLWFWQAHRAERAARASLVEKCEKFPDACRVCCRLCVFPE